MVMTMVMVMESVVVKCWCRGYVFTCTRADVASPELLQMFSLSPVSPHNTRPWPVLSGLLDILLIRDKTLNSN